MLQVEDGLIGADIGIGEGGDQQCALFAKGTQQGANHGLRPALDMSHRGQGDMHEQHPSRANPESEQVIDQVLDVSLDVRYHGSCTPLRCLPRLADGRQIV